MSIETSVTFVVEYERGPNARIQVAGSALRNGDKAGVVIAEERQRKGELREGKIKSVRRDPEG
jgi:hypothetical protein